MRIPTMRAGAAASAGGGWRSAPAARPAARVAPAASLSCLSQCAGPNAYNCMRCGNDMACWTECTGADAGCLRACFAT